MLTAVLAISLIPGARISGPTGGHVVQLGHEPSLSVPLAVTNPSAQPLEVWSAGFWPNHRIVLTDAAGRAVEPTSLGLEGAKRFESPARDKSVRIRIPAGGTYRYETPPLTDFFDLKPGEYTMRVIYSEQHYGKPLRMVTPTIRIKVID